MPKRSHNVRFYSLLIHSVDMYSVLFIPLIFRSIFLCDVSKHWVRLQIANHDDRIQLYVLWMPCLHSICTPGVTQYGPACPTKRRVGCDPTTLHSDRLQTPLHTSLHQITTAHATTSHLSGQQLRVTHASQSMYMTSFSYSAPTTTTNKHTHTYTSY